MFIAALSMIAKIKKQPRCPSVANKYSVAHADNRILFNVKRNELSKRGGNLYAYFSVKEANLKGCVLHDSYQDILEKAKLYKQ